MRCAAIHRKLGTHISKVKSLSMDSWSNEQVENMKKVGNVRSNQIYNPDNKRPPVPVDADEADSAMERFIRTKYMNNIPIPTRKQHSGLSDEGVPPPLPPKSGGKFGFRSASSIFPLSSRLRKDSSLRNTMSSPREPRSPSPSDLPNKPSKVFGASVSYEQEDTERKLASLRDMGFSDGQRNAMVLKGVNGNLERAIETLVRLGESDRRSPSLTGPRESSLRATRSHANLSTSSGLSAPHQTFSDHPQSPSTASSNNPFDMLPPQPQSSQSTGTLQNKNPYANNPFGAPTQQQQDIAQAFGNMSLAPAQPLFPHHTGGLPASQPFAQPQQMYQQSMTPPIPQQQQQQQHHHQQQNYNPMSFNSNMTYPQPIQPQATGYNPFFTNQAQPQQQQNLAVNTGQSSNPYANNPFTRSPTRIQSPSLGQIPEQSQSNFYMDSPQTMTPQSSNPFFAQLGSQPTGQQQVPQQQQQQQQQQMYQQSFQQEQAFSQQQQQQQQQHNPYQQPQQNAFQQPVQQPFQQQAQHPFQQQEMPQQQYQSPAPQPAYQQPQRPDKASILALYSQPQLAPQPFAPQAQAQTQETHPEAAASQQQSQEAASGSMAAGSKNPFLMNGGGGGMSPPPQQAMAAPVANTVGPRKAGVSRESMAFTDMQWTNGRHSPDAFASLSARHM
ncbi:putative GTPase activating protein for Arf-domain-containing protein [Colletotrichum godetiae]|uniref:GTPase activating protein for Arf-domain-containing protein n=1 Tax=Colletotrichum godetiae TaxID=1209918 RepID=A0AAJ0AYA1_9PEZI|nr:putative GTPase activating protein for Arf-domain-containing protein [Colletotrichum godetiae]KAK1700540.1 putative GTPase activating protein for Arf-domain-containing protein [Colletotrichum godetiae]